MLDPVLDTRIWWLTKPARFLPLRDLQSNKEENDIQIVITQIDITTNK